MEAGTEQFTGCLPTSVSYPAGMRLSKKGSRVGGYRLKVKFKEKSEVYKMLEKITKWKK